MERLINQHCLFDVVTMTASTSNSSSCDDSSNNVVWCEQKQQSKQHTICMHSTHHELRHKMNSSSNSSDDSKWKEQKKPHWLEMENAMNTEANKLLNSIICVWVSLWGPWHTRSHTGIGKWIKKNSMHMRQHTQCVEKCWCESLSITPIVCFWVFHCTLIHLQWQRIHWQWLSFSL